MVDLHVHSTRSDGTYTPTELVDYAIQKGLSAFALTDHDTVDGLEEAISYAASLKEKQTESKPLAPVADTEPESACLSPSVEVIPGIELSTEYEGREVHIVGLFIDPQSETFRTYLQEFVESRTNRNLKMCEKFRELGIPVYYETLVEKYPNSVITRAHYARLLTEMGVVKNNKEAFERFLGDRCICYVPREKITPQNGISLILSAGGIPIFAHPILCRYSDARLEKLVAELKDAGLMGIEAIYSTYTPSEERLIRRFAEKYDLCLSGGSDFHGANKPDIDLGIGHGKLYIPDEILDNLKRARGQNK